MVQEPLHSEADPRRLPVYSLRQRWGRVQADSVGDCEDGWLSTRGPGLSANPEDRPHRAMGKGSQPPNSFRQVSTAGRDSSLPGQNHFHSTQPTGRQARHFPRGPSSHVRKWEKEKQSCCREQNTVSLYITLKSVLTGVASVPYVLHFHTPGIPELEATYKVVQFGIPKAECPQPIHVLLVGAMPMAGKSRGCFHFILLQNDIFPNLYRYH